MLPLSTMTVALLSKRRNRFDSRAHLHERSDECTQTRRTSGGWGTGGRGGCRAVLRRYIHLYPISATIEVQGVRPMRGGGETGGARNVRDNPRVRYGAPMVATLRWIYPPVSLLPSPFSLRSFTRPVQAAATHRHHLAIHLGPVLLITRLELRTRTGSAGVRKTVPYL